MDIQTINQEEFDKLHPAMKEYLKAGIDTNRYGSELVTEKNFFNMNLFNADPEELDPSLPTRTENARSKPNYFFAGVKSGLSHGAELIASIPGGLDRFYDWGRETLGLELTEDSIFDHAENFLKDFAHDINPEYNNIINQFTKSSTLLNAEPSGDEKTLKLTFDIVMKEEVVLIAHDRESAEDRFIEFASRKATQLGGELGTTFIDFAEDKEYFDG